MTDLCTKRETTFFPSHQTSERLEGKNLIVLDVEEATGRPRVVAALHVAPESRNGLFVANNPINLWDPYGLYSSWDFLDDASNFSAGMGDAITSIPFTGFSLTRWIRERDPDTYGEGGGVDKCSMAYTGGQIAGIATNLARGAATAASVGSKAISSMTNRATLPSGPSLPPGTPPMF